MRALARQSVTGPWVEYTSVAVGGQKMGQVSEGCQHYFGPVGGFSPGEHEMRVKA